MNGLLLSIIRIKDNDDPNISRGTGFVLTEDGLIATCSHVIQSEESQKEGKPKPDYVKLIFAATNTEGCARIIPEWWRSIEKGDFAILRLVEPSDLPNNVKPIPIGVSSGSAGHTFETFGYPEGNGRWGSGKILPEIPNTQFRGARILQLESPQVTEGFSGAPILDLEIQRVVGMITAIDPYDRHGRGGLNAFALITDELIKVCPELESVLHSTAPTMVQAKAEAVERLSAATKVYEGRMADHPTLESDGVYNYLSSLDIDKLETERLALGAFEAMFEYLETLSDKEVYNPTMLVAECLTALLTQSPRYNQIIQNWQVQGHWTRKMASIRAYSKLAEINPQAVDTSSILYCAADLDRKPILSRQEEVLFSHMARAIGKMKDTSMGEDLIETLAKRKSVSKRVAAGAISINPARAGAIYLLSFLEGLKKRTVEEKAPSVRLLTVLNTLLHDPDPLVKQTAVYTAKDLKRSYPNLRLESYPTKRDWDAAALEIQTRNGHHLPFSGQICRVTEKNLESVTEKIRAGIIYCLEKAGIPEVFFYGGSGLLIPNQSSFSHQCVSLMNAQMPYAMVKHEDIEKLPQGKYAVVDEDGILRVR